MLTFDGKNITFGSGGALSGRVYRNGDEYYAEVYGKEAIRYAEMAQDLLDAGLNYAAENVATAAAQHEYLPAEYWEQMEQIAGQARNNQEQQLETVEILLNHEGNYDDEEMGMLMQSSFEGKISAWAGVVSSGAYLGDILNECRYAWTERNWDRPEAAMTTMLNISQKDSQLALVMDYTAMEVGIYDYMMEMIAVGGMF